MRPDKLLAIKLRKNGKSYNQISKSLNIPKSTLSVWLKDLKISNHAQQKIKSRVNATAIAKLIARNKQQTIIAERSHQQIRRAAEKEAKKLLLNPLFLSGISLYWAEGYKQGAFGSKWKSIDFANSDPQMIKLMVLFFVKFLNIEKNKIKIQIMLHDQKDTEKATNFWHITTGIPKENFIKTCHSLSRASLQKVKNKLLYGTIHLRINDVKSFFRLIGWIDGLKISFKI
ncbi:MAG: helix-turn-helix domain-containing protein [Patescibacteria group bacterium]|jgi:hypothetical protein